jgi:hypothetical protein
MMERFARVVPRRPTADAATLQRVNPSYQTPAGSTLPPSLRDVTTELPA